jgi:hypothetical protein
MLVTGFNDCFSINVKAIAQKRASFMPHLKTPSSARIASLIAKMCMFQATDMRQSSARLLHNDTVNGSKYQVPVSMIELAEINYCHRSKTSIGCPMLLNTIGSRDANPRRTDSVSSQW